MKVAFTTYICPHYRVRTFETLAAYYDVDYLFFSEGAEWFWSKQHGVRSGAFNHEYLPGFRIGRFRIAPTLPFRLWDRQVRVYIKCINGRFALPVTYLVARLRRKPFILWTGVWMRLGTPFHRLFFPVTRYFYRHADAIVTYGEHVSRYLVSEGVSPERIFVAAHAVDNASYNRHISEEDKATLRRELGIAADQKVLLFVGRLEEGKGLTYLLEAFAGLRRDDVVLVFVGSGSKRSQIEELALEYGVADRVRFAGYVEPENTIYYFSIAWALALPSCTTALLRETWGLVVNEAFNQGVPVIATDVVGAVAGGLVQDGVNGLVVPQRDSAALGRAVGRLLDDPALHDSLSQQARQIIEGWDNEKMVSGFRQAIEHVTTRR